MIEINNRMRFIRSSLTCQSLSDSNRFFKIASDRRLCAPTARFSLRFSMRSVKPSNNLTMGRQLNLKIVQVDINKYHSNDDIYSSGNFYKAQQSF